MLAQLASVKGVLYLHRFENEAIVCAKTTNEYFQYLFGPWDWPRIKITKHGQIQHILDFPRWLEMGDRRILPTRRIQGFCAGRAGPCWAAPAMHWTKPSCSLA